MFDIGFSELIVIGLVALVVVGPEKLPRVARTIGHLLGRMQRHVAEVKADINREIQLDEMRRLQGEVVTAAREVETSIREQVREFETAAAPVLDDLGPPPAAAAPLPSVTEPAPVRNDATGDQSGEAPVDTPQLDLFGAAVAPAPNEKP